MTYIEWNRIWKPRTVAPSLIVVLLAVILSWPLSLSPTQQIVEAQSPGICDRSSTVQSALLRATAVASCEDVTSTDLASIDFLYLQFFFGGLIAGDLDGLTGMEWLGLRGDDIVPFPNGVFDDLTSLEFIYIRNSANTLVAADSFLTLSGLTTLESFVLSVPDATDIDPDAFNGLGNVENIALYGDKLIAINADTFDGLGDPAALDSLGIYGDAIATIATDAFANLTNLDYLRIRADAVTEIHAGMFNGLGNLTWLVFFSEGVTTVQSGAFSGVGELIDDTTREEDEDYGVIFLALDAITSLGANTFSGVPNLDRLAISGDMLSTLQPDMFAGLNNLEVLYIDGGEITTVQSGVFDDFSIDHVLITLRLDRGGKEILASGTLSELPNVEAIDVWDESMTTIQAGFFTGLSTLQRLYFDDIGNISRVEKDAFVGLTELTKLDMSNNKVTSLPDGVFRDLINLQVLELGGNPLARLPAEFIASPPCSIETFDISGGGFNKIPTAEIDGVTYNILATLPQPGVNGCGPDQGIRQLIMDDVPFTQADLDLIEPYKVLETLSLANTRITAEQAINVRRGQDLVTLKSLDLSHNDLSGLNEPAQRAALGVVMARLVNLEELHLAGAKIDGDTALVIVQWINPNIVELSLADNNLVDWNHPDLEHDLVSAWSRLWMNWDLIDLSNTAIDSQAAGAIVPNIERTHEGIPEEVIAELDDPGFHTGVTLDLSNNYLSRFGSGWLRNWEFVNVIDLSCNELTTVRPKWFRPVANHLETLILFGNPLDSRPDHDEFDAVLPNTHLHTSAYHACQRSDYSVPKSISRVLRIEPSIKKIAINPGRTVRLEVDIYGRQEVLDNSLADSVNIIWDDEHVGGIFTGSGRRVEYTAPDNPGSHTIIARVSSEQCYGNFDQCTAHFEFKVNRRSTVAADDLVPINPAGPIPSILTDDLGTAYEVFTPVGGGQYTGEGHSLVAPPGAVPDGEFIGVSMRRAGAASNIGQTHHRYIIAGDWYQVEAVDADSQPLTDYRFDSAVEVCVPLPSQLRTKINDVAVVTSTTNSASFTVLSSLVRLQPDGTPQLCGQLSALPAKIAAAKRGAPDALPTVTPSPSEGETLPDTGGASWSIWALILAWIVGASLLVGGLSHAHRRRFL